MSVVRRMELDVTNNSRLLFYDSSALKLTDGVMSSVIVGAATQDAYMEGIGQAARFNWITGFTQIDDTRGCTEDYGNNCLRWARCLSKSTSTLVADTKTQADWMLCSLSLSLCYETKTPTHRLVTDYLNHVLCHVNFIIKGTDIRITSTKARLMTGTLLHRPTCKVTVFHRFS